MTTTPPVPDPAPSTSWQVEAKAPAAPRGAFATLLAFAWEEKAWWLVPMVITLLALSTLVVVASRQQVAPLFYAVNG